MARDRKFLTVHKKSRRMWIINIKITLLKLIQILACALKTLTKLFSKSSVSVVSNYENFSIEISSLLNSPPTELRSSWITSAAIKSVCTRSLFSHDVHTHLKGPNPNEKMSLEKKTAIRIHIIANHHSASFFLITLQLWDWFLTVSIKSSNVW